MPNVIALPLALLLLESSIQPREGVTASTVNEYAALYTDGHELAPIMVYQEGSEYWVADGFHRVAAAQQAGLSGIAAEVRQGTKRDALLYAAGANKHGKPMSNEDKRRVVMRMLEDEEWGGWTDSEIARHCGVSDKTVAKYRGELSSEFPKIATSPTRMAMRNGTSYPMQTANIGKRSAPSLHLIADPPPVVEGQRPTFNQTNEMVDWAKWTWNPVTGCLHNCVYCYARDIAERFYPEKFAPTFRPERLKAPQYTKVPAVAEEQIGYRNVFVCSMADLFGKWVPQEWIDAVLDEVRAAPQWNFLFLTKFPQRLADIQWPHNAWVGTTVDEQYRVEIAEKAFRKVDAAVKWLSCEPLRERLTFTSLAMFDWVVLGGQSKSTQAPAFQPPWEWVDHLLAQARASQCLVYWKANLYTRPQQYPGQS